MGRQAGRVARAGEGRLVGLAAQPGPLEVERRVDLGLALELRAELAGPGVEAAAVGERHAPVERVAQELVAEVVLGPRTPGAIEDERGR